MVDARQTDDSGKAAQEHEGSGAERPPEANARHEMRKHDGQTNATAAACARDDAHDEGPVLLEVMAGYRQDNLGAKGPCRPNKTPCKESDGRPTERTRKQYLTKKELPYLSRSSKGQG